MSVLVPCPGCSRHVRASESACPFCSAALPSDLANRAVPAANRRLSRAAAFTFATTLAVAGAGATEACSSGAAIYGAPAVDSGIADDGGITDDGGAHALYGLAADSGLTDDSGPDDGGAAALYGLPVGDSGVDGD